jgi:predicted nucleotidyltransferase
MNDSSSIFVIVAHVARRLGPVREEVVFLGGAAAALLVSDPIAPRPRPTNDVDVIVEIGSFPEYIKLRERLIDLGFAEDVSEDAPRCRWIVDGIKVDVLATDPPVGFPNRWYRQAIAAARPYDLPAGPTIRLITGPYFLATKLEAFRDRGRGDPVASRDIEDIVAVVDGRTELLTEIFEAPAELQRALRDEVGSLIARPDFADVVSGHLPGDAASQSRVATIIERLRRAAGLAA